MDQLIYFIYTVLTLLSTGEFIWPLVILVIVGCYFAWRFVVMGVLVIALLYSLQVPTAVVNAVIVAVGLLSLPFVRRYLFTFPIYFTMKALKFLPTISKTEKEAIEAGSTWVDAALFSGSPNFNTLMKEGYGTLSSEEQDFLDGPVNQLCEKVIDWDVYKQRDFSPEVWDYIKKNKFFGLIIPKEYGGLGFSAMANSAIVGKVGSRSTPLGIMVMVPNSLGPAELLTHYGTQTQKDYYLPRLAIGEEIPCFALTEPNAGSDAGAMTSKGEIFKGKDGKPWIRLNWNKRYITLAAKATLLGLAFKCYDPDNILGKGHDLGITCALISTAIDGVEIGKRHDPLGVPFYNCPTKGVNVEVPVDSIIGGVDYVGKGWSMLMECLSAGRGISLPANCTAGAKMVTRVVGAYSMIRKQFGLEIGKFEGVQEPISEIVGWTYMLEAARRYTCAGLDDGAKPAVVTALAKYHFTELFRKIINHGMDVVGGAGISLGPRNVLGHPYIAAPIGVTVEGSNILTRSLMIFGQGAIRCHPYALAEIHAIEDNNLAAFDKAFWGHLGHIVKNYVKTIICEVTRGYLILPHRLNSTARYVQKLSWASAKFAFFSDMAMILFGGGLKLRERVTARFGDILAWMYFATAVLKRYEVEGYKKEDWPMVKWCLDYSLHSMQVAFEGLFKNMGPLFYPAGVLAKLNPLGSYPKDSLSAKVAKISQQVGHQRDRVTAGIYISDDLNDAVKKLDHAFEQLAAVAPLYKKIRHGIKQGKIKKAAIRLMIDESVVNGVLTKDEAQRCIDAEDLRDDAVLVDEFTQVEFMQGIKQKKV